MAKWLIFGIGGIGRALVSQIASDSNFEIIFACHGKDKMKFFKKNPKYQIYLFDPKTDKKIIKTIRISRTIDVNDSSVLREIIRNPELKIISTSVRVDNLENVAKILASVLSFRKSKDKLIILVCENIENGGDKFKKLLEKEKKDITKNLIIPNISVDCFVPPQKDLKVVKRELFGELKIEKPNNKTSVNLILNIKNTQLINGKVINHFRKKIIGVSGMHSGIAWLGLKQGHQFVHQAVKDPALQKTIDKLSDEFSEAIFEITNFPKDEIKDYVDDTRIRIGNKNIPDPAERFFRNLRTKLNKDERFLSPAIRIWQKGIYPQALFEILTIGLKKLMKDENLSDPKKTIKEVCQIPKKYQDLENELIKKLT